MKREVAQLGTPCLAVVQVGYRPDSTLYLRMKERAAKEVGISFRHVQLSADAMQTDVCQAINELNADNSVHGIVVQLPLPMGIDECEVTDIVAPSKDADGFNLANLGRLARRGPMPRFVPCTPLGVMKLIEEAQIELAGKRAVVIGRSNIVGLPVFHLLQRAGATVTLAHSKTRNLQAVVGDAEILVAAAGVPGLVKASWLRSDAVVIDVGINSVPDASRKSGYKLVGDVEPEAVRVVQAMTPVPGGVGPMTVCMLLWNTIEAFKSR